jgi:diguanylate cyclase (GGDEF)-like protein/PAS domain S-box-containing protein
MKRNLIQRTQKITLALGLTMILCLNLFMVKNLQTLLESNRLLHRTLVIQGRIDELLSLVTDAETAPRGFVIMGNEIFLEPYYEAVASKRGIGWHLQELRQLIIDPQQQTQLGTLEPLLSEKLAFMKKVVELRRSAGFEGAKRWIASDIGRQKMDKIRLLIAQLKQREDVLLQQRSNLADTNMQQLIVVMTAGLGSAFCLILLTFFIINRESKRRKSAEESLQLLNSELEERVKDRTAKLNSSNENLRVELELRKQNELKISNLSRLYATLSQVNQAILQVKDRVQLFHTICRVAVEYGKFGLAWIGEFDPETALVTPKAVYGATETFLPFTLINIKKEPFRRGVIASAVESGEVVFSNNIQTDPATQQWQEMTIAGGFHAAASVPIRLNGTIVALLNLYAFEAEFFTKEEIALLEEIGGDISFALDTQQSELVHRQTEEALHQSEQRFKTMFEGHSAIMLIIDPDTGFIMEANHAAEKFYGWSIDELRRLRIEEIITLTPEEMEVAKAQTRSGKKNDFLFRHCRADGSVRDVEVYNRMIVSNGKSFLYVIVHDVTERRHYEVATTLHITLLEMEGTHSIKELLQMTLDEAERLTESSIGFFHFVAEDQITLSLEAWSTNTIKKMCNAVGEGQHYALDKAGVWADAAREKRAIIHNNYAAFKDRKGMPEGHAEIKRELVVPVLRNDKVVAMLGVGNKSTDYDESDVKWIGILADIAWDIVAKKNAEEKQKILQAQKYVIENMAMHDSLTALPNRRLLSDRIGQSIAQCRRSNTMAAVMLFDLDKFKPVNDMFGHGIGDLLLQQVASRALEALRRSGDTLARLGGDEFVVLLPQIVAISNAEGVAEMILHALVKPFEIEGHTINISCSIGIAIFPLHGEDELALIKHADDAMYQSKSGGRNCVTVFGGDPL